MKQEIHGTDPQFEGYPLGLLSDSEEQVFEEHLLICDTCCRAIDQNLIFDASIREALAELACAPGWVVWLRPVFTPRIAIAGALASLLAVVGCLSIADNA